MRPLRRFAALPGSDRARFLRTLPLVWAIRLGLWVLSFGRLRKIVAGLAGRPSHRSPSPGEEDRICWAVDSASRFSPSSTCLTRALSAKLLLSRAGHPAALRIGVAKGQGEQLRAHAWVEVGGRVVIGDHRLSEFTPLPSLPGEDT